MPSPRISYSRKDILIKNYLQSKSEVPVSNIIQLAIEYYDKYDDYMKLGTVVATENNDEVTGKSLYFPKESRAYEYLLERQKEGISFKKTICEIVEQGVEIGTENTPLSRAEFLELKKMVHSKSLKRENVKVPEMDAVKKTQTSKNGESEKIQTHTSSDSEQFKPMESEKQNNLKSKAKESEIKLAEKPRRKKADLSFADGFIVKID